jgi:hypothetical protein
VTEQPEPRAAYGLPLKVSLLRAVYKAGRYAPDRYAALVTAAGTRWTCRPSASSRFSSNWRAA